MNNQASSSIPFSELPEGTVTFLFTDIEGSTQLLHGLRERYATLLADQRRLLREAFNKWHGHEVDTQGDAFFVAFSRATQAISAAVEAQRKLAGHDWPDGVHVLVRMGIHTGEPWSAEEGYVGIDVHRAARIAHVAHGGQVVLSETTAALVRDELPHGVSLVDLGRHLLKDLHRPERISQLVIEGLKSEFSVLTSLEVLPGEGVRLPRQVGECPFRGLSAFQEVDAPFYFGRETFINSLERAVTTKNFVAVIVGSSGSGKSSVLFAGLLPKLRQKGGYQFASFRPGSKPFHALAGVLLPFLEPGLSETDHMAETSKLAEHLMKREVTLSQVTVRILEKIPDTRQILLVVDQFEELYTLCPDTRMRKTLIDELLATVETNQGTRDGSVVILLTMRADFMGQALAHRPFADALQEASLLMGPMTRSELHMAIEKPAEMQGAAFESGLVERILDDVGEKPGNLPLLEFTLTQLWERQTDGWLTHTDYEAMGSLEGALATYADQVYDSQNSDEQERTRHAMVQLVQPGEGTEDTRRIATRGELGDDSWNLIQSLADRRLVVTGLDAQGHETAEVVHEALIQKWGLFQEWMNEDRAFRAWQERLRANLRQWQESGHDEGALLGGVPLAVAQNWLAEQQSQISQPETDYIQKSLALQTRQQKAGQRRRRWAVLGLTAGMLITIIFAVFMLYQRQNSLRQASIGLASQAQLELDGTSPERSVLLALEALENYPYTWQAEKTLGQIVRDFRLRFILTGHSDTVQDVAWSLDGFWIATGGNDGTLRIWNAQTHAEVLKISAHPASLAIIGGVRDLAWSPDGAYLATAGQEGTAKVWERETGKQISLFSAHTDKVWGVAWSPDGDWIASASKDGTAKVWNALTGEEKFTLSGHNEWVKMVTWSPDGKHIATSGDDGTVRIWDAVTSQEHLMLSGHTNWVWSVAWSPDGTRLATASEDGTVRVWKASSGREISDIRLASPVWEAAWSPDGNHLATTDATGSARVWDIATGKEAFALQGHTTEPFDIAWSPDGRSLATTAGAGYSVRIWDALPAALTLSVDDGAIGWTSWSPDGKIIAAVSYLDHTVVIWDSETGGTQLIIQTGDTDDMQDVFWSPDGSRIVTTSWDMLAKVWDATTGKELLTFSGHVGEHQNRFQGRDALFGGGWSPDGSQIVTAGGYGWVRVWDALTGKQYLSFLATIDWGASARWSPDGKRLATCSPPEVLQIWDAETGTPILNGFVDNLKNLSIGDPVDMCLGSEWSPDGSRILTTLWSGNSASLWDAKSGKRIFTFKEHTSPITFSTWSPNGKRIATGDVSGMIKIWDAQTGVGLLSYSVPIGDNMLFQLSWSPDGTRLVGSSFLSSVEVHRVWQSKEELVNYAKECCMIRQLTEAERQQFGLP